MNRHPVVKANHLRVRDPTGDLNEISTCRFERGKQVVLFTPIKGNGRNK